MKQDFKHNWEEAVQTVQGLLRKFAPVSFAVSAISKLVIIALLVYSPSCAQANDAVGEITGAARTAIVQKLEAGMNATKTLKARFNQANMDGTIESGTFYLWRPGRLRFEYDPPKGDYIVADGLLVHYWDHGVKNYSNAPIGSTMADFLLQKKIKFSGDLQVVSLRRPQNGKLVLTLNQVKNPEAGDVRLLFNESNAQLEKWRVTDGTGSITEVTLSAIEKDIALNPVLFRFRPPKGYDKDWINTR